MGYETLYQPKSGVIIGQQGEVIDTADSYDPLGGIVVYDELQSAIHKGEAFSYSNYGTLSSLGSVSFLGRTGAKQVHFDGMSVDFQAGGVRVELIEAPTVTSDGTPQTGRRKNRAIASTATMSLFTGSVSTGGTIVFSYQPPVVAGQGNSITSASTGIVAGWVLKENTDYIIRFTNSNATAATYSVDFGWHEPSILLS